MKREKKKKGMWKIFRNFCADFEFLFNFAKFLSNKQNSPFVLSKILAKFVKIFHIKLRLLLKKNRFRTKTRENFKKIRKMLSNKKLKPKNLKSIQKKRILLKTKVFQKQKQKVFTKSGI